MTQHAPSTAGRVHLARGVGFGEQAIMPVLALISFVGLVVARVWPVQSVVSGDPTCLLRLMTGLPCPGCGLTRSWVHVAHGDLLTAFEYNLFGPVSMAMAAGIVVWTVVSYVRRRPPQRLLDRLDPRLLLVVFGLWMAYSVVRMVSLGMGQDYFALVLA